MKLRQLLEFFCFELLTSSTCSVADFIKRYSKSLHPIGTVWKFAMNYWYIIFDRRIWCNWSWRGFFWKIFIGYHSTIFTMPLKVYKLGVKDGFQLFLLGEVDSGWKYDYRTLFPFWYYYFLEFVFVAGIFRKFVEL